MPVNDKQKIAVLDISAQTQQLIEDKLNQGAVIQFIVALQTLNKLLIVYATPAEI